MAPITPPSGSEIAVEVSSKIKLERVSIDAYGLVTIDYTPRELYDKRKLYPKGWGADVFKVYFDFYSVDQDYINITSETVSTSDT